jgi:hypothetical protein
MACSTRKDLHHITLTSQQHYTHSQKQQHNRNSPTILSGPSCHFQPQQPRTNMYTSILFAALAATSAFAMPAVTNELVARQALDPNSVAVTVNNATLGGDTTFRSDNFPETQEALGGIVGPYDSVTLTLGSEIIDTTLRCQILGTDGNIIRLNRGDNKNKSTFSAGKPWAFVNGLTEVAAITCPVAAPVGE